MTNQPKFNPSRRTVLGSVIGGAAALSTTSLMGCKPAAARFDTDVLVLGAGLSGLHAARLLQAEGRDVMVAEGSSRIGGRMFTLSHDGGNYTEGGGEQVGANYARILDTAAQLGVGMTPDSGTRRGTAYFYGGKTMGPEAWAAMDVHPFKGPFKGASPAAPLYGLAGRGNPLKESADWRDSNFADFDITAEAFLAGKGITAAGRAVIDRALNGNSIGSYSMMNLYRTLQLYGQSRGMGPSLSVDGGAQRLPEAMAASLSNAVKINTEIAAISVTDDAVIVTDTNGKTIRAQHCICALPFGALRHLKIDAPMGAAQAAAIENLPYTQILQFHFKTDTPFWEADGLPADMWIDGPLERIFMARGDDDKPNGYGRVWMNGTGAAQMAALPREAQEAALKQGLAAMRPIKESDITLLAVPNWTSQNTLAGGAYMHWAPGQIERWAGVMGAPAGRLSFAGEHLSYLHTGMEGAMESGENAAFALMNI